MTISARRVAELRETLSRASHAYYVLDQPSLSDAQYDQYFRELQRLERENPHLASASSPTQQVGASVQDSPLAKVRHPEPMLSLANAMQASDVRDWYARVQRLLGVGTHAIDLVFEPKIDGLSVSLIYENGSLARAATRGDGEVGEDVTHNARTIASIPHHLSGSDVPVRVEVRGEVYIGITDFERYNAALAAQGSPVAANPRNAAAGALRQKNAKIAANRPIAFYAYQVLGTVGCRKATSQSEAWQQLQQWGFITPPDIAACASLDITLNYIHNWMTRRDQLDIEVDGAVLKVNKYDLQARLGVSGRDPRWAIAYKFPPREEQTLLRDIVCTVGRTGRIIPNAVLEPVRLGGTTVRHATLHNFDYIRDRDIRIGDTVVVRRAGDVIPAVIGPVLSLRSSHVLQWNMPTACPECSAMLEQAEGEVDYRCPNIAGCAAQLQRRIEHFAGRSNMDMRGLGSEIISALIDRGVASNVADLYSLTAQTFAQWDGFGERRIKMVLDTIEQSKQQSPDRILAGLGIRQVGNTMSKILLQFGSIRAIATTSEPDLASVTGVGVSAARRLRAFFDDPASHVLLDRLAAAGLPIDAYLPNTQNSGVFQGMSFVVTGTMRVPREQIEQMLASHGAKVGGSVSKGTSYLVAGTSPGASKLVAAQKYSTPVLNEQELEVLLRSKGLQATTAAADVTAVSHPAQPPSDQLSLW